MRAGVTWYSCRWDERASYWPTSHLLPISIQSARYACWPPRAGLSWPCWCAPPPPPFSGWWSMPTPNYSHTLSYSLNVFISLCNASFWSHDIYSSGEGSSSVALLKGSSLSPPPWKLVFSYFLRVFPDPMWGQRSGCRTCTDCKALWGTFVICDIGLYKINWIELKNPVPEHRFTYIWVFLTSHYRDSVPVCIVFIACFPSLLVSFAVIVADVRSPTIRHHICVI